MMHPAYTNYGGGGSGNMQQMQGPQQLHLPQRQLQQHWNNHIGQKRSKYYYTKNQARNLKRFKYSTAKSVCPSDHLIISYISFCKVTRVFGL